MTVETIGEYKYMKTGFKVFVFENIGLGERIISVFSINAEYKPDDGSDKLNSELVSDFDGDYQELYDNALMMLGI